MEHSFEVVIRDQSLGLHKHKLFNLNRTRITEVYDNYLVLDCNSSDEIVYVFRGERDAQELHTTIQLRAYKE